ncbi:basic leucine zipper and W2 domain-containing protein 1-like [Asparagus officinalis]|uniref:basic leucine zipper and W2 domain-containing protein 1-like n=1 Tax=Asparagus officinalis TaxID=4686 RepID=UPI00098E41DA|nr:basic leucine zipper and W2 domain-containing protein 1-like [Asparagus officinalis]
MFKALKEMKSTLIHQVFMDFDIHDVIKTVAEGIEKNKIPHTEVVPILWDALMDTIVYRDVRVRPELLECYVSTKVFLWSELLRAFCLTEECELELLKQVHRRSIKE